MNDDYGVLDVIVSAYKDKVAAEELEKMRQEYMLVLETEAASRRVKADALIRQMSALKIALSRFEFTYQRIRNKFGTDIPEIDKFISDINLKIKKISYEKNNLISKGN